MTNFYITTPIYYVNDQPHIGHAYTSLACDVMARFMRMDGNKVFFLSGTDEHGQKVATAAKKSGLSPQQFTDQVSANFRQLAEDLNCSLDGFIRTTSTKHHKTAQKLWCQLEDSDQIYRGQYEGWYSVREESFIVPSEVVTNAHGQHCSAQGEVLEWVEEESYFFRLSNWQQRLLDMYKKNPERIAPAMRRNEVIRFIESGLRDLSVSRSGLSWGIPVPGQESHVMYVWIDALANYLTAIGYSDDQKTFVDWWPANHVIGKDILRFHAVYWPAMLMAVGVEPPRQIFAHGWWTNEGQKISKSLGNTIDPIGLIDSWGCDVLRYFLLREVPFGQDGDFSLQALKNRINGDLCNGLGNLAQRVLQFIQKNGAKIPEPGPLQGPDQALRNDINAMLDDMRQAMVDFAFSRALERAWSLVGHANRYIDEMKPWVLRKSNPERMHHVLYLLCDVLRHLSFTLAPFMPERMSVLRGFLALNDSSLAFEELEKPLAPGTSLPTPNILYQRAES